MKIISDFLTTSTGWNNIKHCLDNLPNCTSNIFSMLPELTTSQKVATAISAAALFFPPVSATDSKERLRTAAGGVLFGVLLGHDKTVKMATIALTLSYLVRYFRDEERANFLQDGRVFKDQKFAKINVTCDLADRFRVGEEIFGYLLLQKKHIVRSTFVTLFFTKTVEGKLPPMGVAIDNEIYSHLRAEPCPRQSAVLKMQVNDQVVPVTTQTERIASCTSKSFVGLRLLGVGYKSEKLEQTVNVHL